MREKFLKDIVIMVVGVGSDKVVDVLYKKKNVNEFLIAKKLNMTINQARNVLYKLADEGIVVFNRKKDKKSGGWYTYFWTFNEYRALLNLRDKILKEIEEMNNQVYSKKSKQFYVCSSCGMEVSEENALTYDFTCPECGQVFHLKDNSTDISKKEKSVLQLKEKSALVEGEISLLKDKDDAFKVRKMAKEKKEKLDLRRAGRKKAIRDKKRKEKKINRQRKGSKIIKKKIKKKNKAKKSSRKRKK